MSKTIFLKIQFPEITLKTRDAHKLRGYFGDLFREHSSVLHNHYETGELKYQYPLVQYKVLNGIPTLVALEEGARLLTKLFLKIEEINIDGIKYPVHNKNMKSEEVDIGYSEELHEYSFETLWMGLNQDNYRKYVTLETGEKYQLLRPIMVGNVLSFFKSLGVHLDDNQRLFAKVKTSEKSTKFKDKDMLAFEGSFVINALMPDYIGLGKAVSRGFGTIKKI